MVFPGFLELNLCGFGVDILLIKYSCTVPRVGGEDFADSALFLSLVLLFDTPSDKKDK